MKNKNTTEQNRTVAELVNLIQELAEKKYDSSARYAYTTGVLQAILDWEVKGFNSGTLQENINDCYERNLQELNALKAA
jgi:hypothetical protein